MLKILYIGNSFSQDATRYLEEVSDGKLFVRNLYIGGCSLERHAHNIVNSAVDYDYEIRAKGVEKISVNEAIFREKWDVISVQQVSFLSGLPDDYEPYLAYVVDYLRKNCPDAKLVFHRTWSYEDGNPREDFGSYRFDRRYMLSCIVKCTELVCEKYGLGIIPVGDAVEIARDYPEFDPKRGGVSLNRDGSHLSYDYGRYLASLVHYRYLTGDDCNNVSFVPPEFSEKLVCILRDAANRAVTSFLN